MICISFSLFIVFSFAFIMNPFNHVHAFSSILFFSTLKIRIHVFRQIRCRPQSAILRALWTSVLTRTVKTMLFDSHDTRNDENRCENRNERFYHSDTMNPMGLIHRFRHSSMIAGIMLSITLVYSRRNECFCCNHNVDMSA